MAKQKSEPKTLYQQFVETPLEDKVKLFKNIKDHMDEVALNLQNQLSDYNAINGKK